MLRIIIQRLGNKANDGKLYPVNKTKSTIFLKKRRFRKMFGLEN